MPHHSAHRRRSARHHKKRVRVFVVTALVLLLLISPLVFISMLTDSRSSVATAAESDARAIVRVKQLSQALERGLVSGAVQASITLGQEDINGVVGIASLADPRLKGRINVTRWGLEGALSISLSQWFLGNYLNVGFGIAPSELGVRVGYLSVGSFSFSGANALGIGEWLVNKLTGNEVGSLILNSVDAVSIDGPLVTIIYRPTAELNKQFTLFRSKVKHMRDDKGLMGNLALVRTYYKHLCDFSELSQTSENMSMGQYLSSSFELAQRRTLAGADPVEENRAALLALGLGLGSLKFEIFVGPVGEDMQQDCSSLTENVDLAGRRELGRHFIYSTMLTVLSDSGVGFAVSELNDMMNFEGGDDGFSFVELLVDRTGVRFAELALDDRGGATRLQAAAASFVDESSFLPAFDGLQEGVAEPEFERRYGGSAGVRYRGVVKDIDSRMLTLSLYNRWLEPK